MGMGQFKTEPRKETEKEERRRLVDAKYDEIASENAKTYGKVLAGCLAVGVAALTKDAAMALWRIISEYWRPIEGKGAKPHKGGIYTPLADGDKAKVGRLDLPKFFGLNPKDKHQANAWGASIQKMLRPAGMVLGYFQDKEMAQEAFLSLFEEKPLTLDAVEKTARERGKAGEEPFAPYLGVTNEAAKVWRQNVTAVLNRVAVTDRSAFKTAKRADSIADSLVNKDFDIIRNALDAALKRIEGHKLAAAVTAALDVPSTVPEAEVGGNVVAAAEADATI